MYHIVFNWNNVLWHQKYIKYISETEYLTKHLRQSFSSGHRFLHWLRSKLANSVYMTELMHAKLHNNRLTLVKMANTCKNVWKTNISSTLYHFNACCRLYAVASKKYISYLQWATGTTEQLASAIISNNSTVWPINFSNATSLRPTSYKQNISVV